MKKFFILAVYAALGILLFALVRESYGPDYIGKVRFKKMIYQREVGASSPYAWVEIIENKTMNNRGIHTSKDGCRANVPVSGRADYEEGKVYYIYEGKYFYLTETPQSRITARFCLAIVLLIVDGVLIIPVLKRRR